MNAQLVTFTEITPSMIGDRDPFLLMYRACRYCMALASAMPKEADVARAEMFAAACECMQCATETARRAA